MREGTVLSGDLDVWYRGVESVCEARRGSARV